MVYNEPVKGSNSTSIDIVSFVALILLQPIRESCLVIGQFTE